MYSYNGREKCNYIKKDKKRANQTKPRLALVRLDDGDVAPISVKRPEPRDDSLSGAIKDVLLRSETGPCMSGSSRSKNHGHSHTKERRHRGKEIDLKGKWVTLDYSYEWVCPMPPTCVARTSFYILLD